MMRGQGVIRLGQAALGVLGLVVAAGAAQATSELFLIDFEDLPEETEISDQYADLGVVFSIDGYPDELPIIAVEGNPTVAFTGSGADTPMSSGVGGLTDPIVGGEISVGRNIVMQFDPPVTSVRLFIIDIDVDDVMTLRAFDGGTEVDSMTKATGDPGTGNGKSTPFLVSADSITSAIVEVPEFTGFAVDFLIFTRPCEGAACGPQIEISQESAPGTGDFDDHELGLLQAFPFNDTPAKFYGYDIPEGSSWNGPWMTPVPDRTNLIFANTSEGLTLFVVHDCAVPEDPDGGEAEMLFEMSNDADGAERTVEDDPDTPDIYTGEAGDYLFTADNVWSECCTDGVALSGLDCQSVMILQFTDVDDNPDTPAIAGLTEWVAHSAEGTEIPLALEEGRRVRLVVVPDPDCPADLTCDAVVNIDDLFAVLAAWGQSGVLADINEDGIVNIDDLFAVLGVWGPCP